ncbi:hypothetical protein H1P_4920008 [Hyella patelloides LEGE 07179]|uniref:Uncharacterized protein n=1 Tax=Hyella patelloides LEGE 07179 TaxID=945734 RepID=A0A563VZC0_9CYAN|nr:hypothetical protein [Hyella patelloides]VEP16769.1 hypothetical protein H1P_4920008 [Hyella patelloides LEGE 07179]
MTNATLPDSIPAWYGLEEKNTSKGWSPKIEDIAALFKNGVFWVTNAA